MAIRILLIRAVVVLLVVTGVTTAMEVHAVPEGRGAVGMVRLYPGDAQPITQVRVVADGATIALNARVLWSAPGQPTDVLFDSSGGTPITVTTGVAGSAAWDPPDGLILETRHRAEGDISSWEGFQQVWKNSTPVQGRSLVPHVFDGLNRHGPHDDFCSLYSGWLRVEQAGDYVIATVSDDGSWLFIDDRPVCEWPGWHGADEGLRGKFSATFHLTAGRHRFRYAHVQGTGGTIAEAAWKPPGADRFQVIPPEAFGLVARYRVDVVTKEADAFNWIPEGHCRIDDQTLVTVRLQSVGRQTLRWRIAAADTEDVAGDELVADGADIRVPLAQGRWRIQGGAVVRFVHISPLWSQVDDWDDTRWAAQRSELMTRRETMPLTLLTCGMRMAKLLDDGELTTRLAEALEARLTTKKIYIGVGSGDDLGWIAQRLQASDVRRYDTSAAVFAAAIAAPGLAPVIADHLRLHWAGLKIHIAGDGAAGEQLLKTIDRTRLDDGERRLLALYLADARLAQGDVAGCKQLLAAVADQVDPADTGYALRRRARLERAHELLLRGEWDAAEGPLREIEWETPRERIGIETGALLIQVWLGRGELPIALTRCRFLSLAAPDDQRLSDVLLLQIKVQLVGGDRAGAMTTIARLKKDFPYSEAAARVHDIRIPEKP